MGKKRIAVLLTLVSLLSFLLTSCRAKEKPLFDSDPVDMYFPENHGFDSNVYDILALDSVTVTFEEIDIDPSVPEPTVIVTDKQVYSYTNLESSDHSFAASPNSYLLTFYSFGGWTYFDRYGSPISDGVSYYIPEGGNASRIDIVLDKEFHERTNLIQGVCKGSYGIQIEKTLPDGNRGYYFAHPDGYLFMPVDPSEYVDNTVEFLDMAILPSGLKYAKISEEEFALLSALSVMYGGRQKVNQTLKFRAEDGLLPDEYSEYCMCISSSDSHLDLSYTQALEFLSRYLGWKNNEIRITETASNPDVREGLSDLIRITEYRGSSIETCFYLTPSGMLIGIEDERLIDSGKLIPESRFSKAIRVNCLMTWVTQAVLDYDAVKALLHAV